LGLDLNNAKGFPKSARHHGNWGWHILFTIRYLFLFCFSLFNFQQKVVTAIPMMIMMTMMMTTTKMMTITKATIAIITESLATVTMTTANAPSQSHLPSCPP